MTTTSFEHELTEDSGNHASSSHVEPSKRARVVVTAIVIVPFITAVVRALRNDWFPIGDNALLFIRARDAFTDNHPFLGSWTSASLSVGENMNNPGAMYDWLIAPFAHLLPPGPAAAIGVATINVAMVCAISAVAHRVGGWAFQRWALLATALMAWSMGSELLIDIWQANALIFAFMALLIIAVGVASGDDGLLPLAAVVTSLLLQTHISYAYIVVFIVIGVVGARVWLRRVRPPDHGASDWRRPAAVSVGVLAVLWAPSLWEQFFGPGKGNMSRLLGNSSGGDFSLGLGNAARIVGSLGVRPPFWGRSGYTTTVVGTRITETPSGPTLDIPGLVPLAAAIVGLGVLLALLVGLSLLAQRSHRRNEAAAGVVAAVVLVGSVVSLGRLTIGDVGLSPHHVRWAWPLMAFVHLVIVWLVAAALLRHREDRRTARVDRAVGVVIGAAITLVSLLNIGYLAQPSGPTADTALLPTMRRIEPQLARLTGHDPVLYDISTLRVFEPYSSTMMMWLQEQGIEFRVDDEGMVRQLGEERRADGSEPTRIFQLEGIDARTYDGPACPFAEASLLEPRDDAEARDLLDAASRELAASMGTTPKAAFEALVRGEFDTFEMFDADEQALVDTWTDSAYVLFADGDVCDQLDPA